LREFVLDFPLTYFREKKRTRGRPQCFQPLRSARAKIDLPRVKSRETKLRKFGNPVLKKEIRKTIFTPAAERAGMKAFATARAHRTRSAQ